jgi:lipopolysaccharide export system protein LptA
MDNSSIKATIPFFPGPPGGGDGGAIEVTAEHVALSNHSTIDTSTRVLAFKDTAPGNITFNAGTFSATDSTISTTSDGVGGAVTIQGLKGPGTSAHTVSLTNTTLTTSSNDAGEFEFRPVGGTIGIRADNIALNQAALHADANSDGNGGVISLVSSRNIESHDSVFSATSSFNNGGTIDLKAGTGIDLTNTSIDAHASPGIPTANGGTIHIDGGAKFSSEHSTLSATSSVGNGGTIKIEANKVGLTDTQVTTSVSGGPQTVGGSITVDANKVTLDNSQVLSTATEGQGGTIDITSHALHQDANSVIDASSQFGTDGTVTIH